jgi:hypothetical protein
MVSSPDLAHGTPPNKWLISHGDRFSKVSLCALFSLTSSTSLPTPRPVSPFLVGPSPKEEGDSRKRPRMHAAGRISSDHKRSPSFSRLQVLSVSSGAAGRRCRGAPCASQHPQRSRTQGDACPGCRTPSQTKREGDSILLARRKISIPFTGRTDRALGHLVPNDTDFGSPL